MASRPPDDALARALAAGGEARRRARLAGRIRALVRRGLADGAVADALAAKGLDAPADLVREVRAGLSAGDAGAAGDAGDAAGDGLLGALVGRRLAREDPAGLDRAGRRRLKGRVLAWLEARGHDPERAAPLLDRSLGLPDDDGGEAP